MPNPADDSLPANTLRLEGAALTRMQETLDANENSSQAKMMMVRREHRRWQFRSSGTKVEVQHPDGQVVSIVLAARNLSAGGMSLLHSAFMHPGTKVTVHLRQHERGLVPLAAVVKRCRHVTGRLHEVGLKFEKPIDVTSFLDIDPFHGQFCLEAIKPEKLAGKLLHVEDGALDRKLVKHMLEETRLIVTSVENAQQALEKIKEPWDAWLVDVRMPGMNGLDLIEKARAEGVQVPMILVTADKSPEVRTRAKQVRANGVISKPFKGETLLAALAQMLLNTSNARDTGGTINTTLASDDPLMHLVPDFVKELQAAATRMRQAFKSGQAETLKLECFQIVGAASTLGLEPVSKAAEEAVRVLGSVANLQDASRVVQDLIASCLRVRMPIVSAAA